MKTKQLTLMGALIALSVVGSMIKIPAITGTPALDSAFAFVAGILLGPVYGATVGFLGHMATALTAGFPLSLPIHLLIGAEMAIIVYIFSKVYSKNKIVAYVLAFILNGIVSPASFIPIFGMGFFAAMVLPLMIATALNISVAAVTGEYLEKKKVFINA